MNLDVLIESILFFKGEPVTITELSRILEVSSEEIKKAISILSEKLLNRGISLIQHAESVMLATHKDAGVLLEKIAKEELSKDLSKPALETLAIVIYKGPIKRSVIDSIRGVNSQFILRNLMTRGLVEKLADPDDQRSFIYRATTDLLQHLGITEISHMPEYAQIINNIESYASEKQNDASVSNSSTKEVIEEGNSTSSN